MLRQFALAFVLLVVASCRSSAVRSEDQPTPEGAPPPAAADHIPVGLEMTARLDQTLSTESSRVGDPFTATVTESVVARTGETLIPTGATIHGSVTALDDSDHLGDIAYIRLGFDRITLNGREYSFSANVTDTAIQVEAKGERRTAERAGMGAAAGAVLGAVLGGDWKDAVTGAAIGAGVGTAISLGLGEVEAALPAGTIMTVRATERVDLR